MDDPLQDLSAQIRTDMTNCTQGPFGRVLPVPDDHEVPEHVLGPMDETRSTTMAIYSLPRPALEFGSDSRGFTDPLRYSSQRSALPSTMQHDRNDPSEERPRTIVYDSLPNVNQLLLPATQSGVLQSPHLPHHSTEQRLPLSAGQIQPTELSPSDAEKIHQSNRQSLHPPPVFQTAQESAARGSGYTASLTPQLPLPPSLPQTYVPHSSSNQTPYSSYVGPAHQAPYIPYTLPQTIASTGYQSQLPPQQKPTATSITVPHQTFHLNPPVQHSGDAPGFSNVAIKPEGSPEQFGKSTVNPVKLTPRVVREDVLPGEGPVWVYEDGSTCPKVIDGEPVNAEWGITKAGKPRKRLAIACTNCREKKIKCQPALPKCAQCGKLGRECHYATA